MLKTLFAIFIGETRRLVTVNRRFIGVDRDNERRVVSLFLYDRMDPAMRRNFLTRCIGAASLMAIGVKQAGGTVLPEARIEAGISPRIRQLLSAYSGNRPDEVVAMLDPDGWVVFGSDVSEIVRTEAALREMMDADFALWHTAAFGEIRDLEVRTEGALATAMFHVDFSAGGRPAIPVRFCTTWRRVRGAWMLSQCANTVPTVHSSAAELLRR